MNHRRCFIMLLVTVAVILAANAQQHSAAETGQATSLQARVSALETQVAALVARVTALEQSVGRPERGATPHQPPAGADVPHISWDEAPGYVGREVVVEGPVVAVTFAEHIAGQPTFVNLGASYPNPKRFTVIIWQRDRHKFAPGPEQMFAGRTVRVRGEIGVYHDSPEMRITTPDAVETVR